MNDTEKDLVAIAKRENNKKRNYLVVNPLQGKHIPVSPSKALELFGRLAEKIRGLYGQERLLLIGFAETATAIGAHVASCLGTLYIQTTRETVSGADYLFFSEIHSHATEQKLVKEDMDKVLPQIDRVIFIEDEVTTGNTILNIIDILERDYTCEIRFSVASLLNGMNQEALTAYKDRNIDIHYLVKTNHDKYQEKAEQMMDDGKYFKPDMRYDVVPREIRITGLVNARRLVDAGRYGTACERLWKETENMLSVESGKKYLVVGTEEFMYPALYIGKKMEELGGIVKSHSTTRSPILVSKDAAYPLHTRYELKSLYDRERITYLYNLDRYDAVVVITDSQSSEKEGAFTLYHALSFCSSNIMMIRWCEN